MTSLRFEKEICISKINSKMEILEFVEFEF